MDIVDLPKEPLADNKEKLSSLSLMQYALVAAFSIGSVIGLMNLDKLTQSSNVKKFYDKEKKICVDYSRFGFMIDRYELKVTISSDTSSVSCIDKFYRTGMPDGLDLIVDNVGNKIIDSVQTSNYQKMFDKYVKMSRVAIE